MSTKETARMWQLAGKYSAVGIEMAVSVAIGAVGGNWLDTRLGTTPWFMLFGFVVGAGAAVQAIRRILAMGKKDEA